MLLPVLVASSLTVAGVVGGNVIDLRVASTAAEQQAAVVPEPQAPLTAPPAPAEPAPVLKGARLRLRPVPVVTPDPATTKAPVPNRPFVVPRTTSVPTVPTPTPAPIPSAPATVSITQANLYQGMSAGTFAQDLATVASTRPDFITLNEAGHRGDAEIRPAGYASYRATGSPYLAETPVLWRTDRWTQVDAGNRWLTPPKV